MATGWLGFKERVAEDLEKRYPASERWTISRDYTLDSGGELDFLVGREGERIAIRIKEEEGGNVVFEMLDQVADYAREAKARPVLYISQETHAPDILLKYAQRNAIAIERL